MNAPRRTLLTRPQFQARRSTLLPHILLLKQSLRTRITPYLSVLFETEATVMWQVYEQLRVEGPWTLQRAEALLAEYSALLPTPISRAATVFVDGAPHPGMTTALAATPGTLSVHAGRQQWPGCPVGTPDPDGAVHYIAFDLRCAPPGATLHAHLGSMRWKAALPDGLASPPEHLADLMPGLR